MADQKRKDVYYPSLGMTESERQAKLVELKANPNRQPADDAELDRLLNLPANAVKEEVDVLTPSAKSKKPAKKSKSVVSKKKVSKPVNKSGTTTTKSILKK